MSNRLQVRLGLIGTVAFCALLVIFGGSSQQGLRAQDHHQIHPEELKNEGAIQKMCPECKGVHHGHVGHDDYYKRRHALPSLVEPRLFAPLLLGILLLILALLFRKKKETGNESIST